jgi:hypothetical protein
MHVRHALLHAPGIRDHQHRRRPDDQPEHTQVPTIGAPPQARAGSGSARGKGGAETATCWVPIRTSVLGKCSSYSREMQPRSAAPYNRMVRFRPLSGYADCSSVSPIMSGRG